MYSTCDSNNHLKRNYLFEMKCILTLLINQIIVSGQSIIIDHGISSSIRHIRP